MASIAMTIIPSDLYKVSCETRSGQAVTRTCNYGNIRYCNVQQDMCRSLLFSYKPHTRCLIKPVSAVSSGFQAPIDNYKFSVEAKVVVKSQDKEKMQVKVDVSGKETEKVYDAVLENLASNSPPLPGFRKLKGGKTEVPKSILIQSFGETRVNKFVIEEILSATMAEYAEKENLKVKENKVETIQTEKQLVKSFKPGKNFSFNAKLLLDEEAEDSTLTSDDED